MVYWKATEARGCEGSHLRLQHIAQMALVLRAREAGAIQLLIDPLPVGHVTPEDEFAVGWARWVPCAVMRH